MIDKKEIIEQAQKHYSSHSSPCQSTFSSDPKTCSTGTVYRNFDSWKEMLDESGIHWRYKNSYSKEDLVEAIHEFYEENESIDFESVAEDSYYPAVHSFRKEFNDFGSFLSYAFEKPPSDYHECPECKGYYKRMSLHWKQSECVYPEIIDRQKDILRGCLMGDGTLHIREDRMTTFEISLITREYLEWLKEELSSLVFSEIKLKEPERTMEKNGESYQCSPYYRLRLNSHPLFDEWANEWYSEEGKTFPLDKINPTVAKHWFVTDGGLRWNGNNLNGVYIACYNENHTEEELKSLFSSFEFTPDFVDGGKLFFSASKGREFLKWIGSDVPGFEYKWECDERAKYNLLKD